MFPNGNIQIITNDNQKNPYALNAVAPNVLPALNSIIPANICATPPNAIPIAIVTIDNGIIPELCKLRSIVVIPKPRRPNGAGFAVFDSMFIVNLYDIAYN